MVLLEEINYVSGIILIVYILLAGKYWTDIERWATQEMRLKNKEDKAKAKLYKEKAEKTFNRCTFLILFTIILFILPVYIPNEIIYTLSKWLLLIPLAILIYLSLCWWRRKYIVPPYLT